MTPEEKIQSLINTANTVTGKSRTDLTACIQDLKNGYTGPTLPAEYQEVEWVGSSGTQYINTGFAPDNNTRVVMKYVKYKNTTSSWNPFGARLNSSSQMFTIALSNDERYRSHYGNTTGTYTNVVGDWFDIDKNKNVTTINGVATSTITAQTFSVAYNLYLFVWNSAGSALAGGGGYIFSCKIWDNDTLIRDLVPCYRIADTEIGFYDLVNDVFYTNAGTGTFTKGADV